jgi:hypothetical protein
VSKRNEWGRETDSVRQTKQIAQCSYLVLLDACTFIRGLAAEKDVLFLQFVLTKLEVSVPQYFGTGPTILWYRGTV